MEEMVNNLVENTLKKDNAKDIIVKRILWYEMKLLEKDEKIDKAIEFIEEHSIIENNEITTGFEKSSLNKLYRILRGEK